MSHADDHDHAAHTDQPVAARVRRLEERVIAAGLTTDEELDSFLRTFLERASPLNGARLVARAWTDPAFRDLLLADGNAAVAELGLAPGDPARQGYRLQVVENTRDTHNVIVCTLCSCYPLSLLGPSPSWYKSHAYRARVVREPRAVLAEFGLELPGEVEIAVWDSTSEARYMVLPRRPDGTEDLDEERLTGLVTREGLIGTALV
ncbi:nitrile hydratase subunit alpha [Actinomadura sp. NBRC 104412]|uniref:nitrile hydratase subunit alpha n=1 Tax=Actinomadura sp. NBRC 104412 TaxID=3032203 RepID=UPI0024A0095F|nr:nitrile hydratase subunit alpha [Actinomadura sp. NBRC 104412]GLZ08870.1 nitrile hydratase subunit alpha [Actinomadura sp. NBRC 104412]